MPLSSKERYARFRAKLMADPAAREENLARRRERQRQRKQAGEGNHYHTVKELTTVAHAKKKEQWRLHQKKCREKKRQVEALMNLTPVSEDSFVDEHHDHPEPFQHFSPPGPSQHSTPPGPSQQCSTPHKPPKKTTSSSRTGQRTKKLREEIAQLKRDLVKEKRRADRCRKKANRLMITKRRKEIKNRSTKIFRKGPARRRSVVEFLTRDENSRLLPGKKDTVSKDRVKEQRRVLSKSLKELHKEYNAEVGEGCVVSYRQFVRLRPFYVTEPKANDRNTCACLDHENVSLLLEKLHQSGLVASKSTTEALGNIVCDMKSRECMHRLCTKCCYTEMEPLLPDESGQVSWSQWQREKVCTDGKTYSHFVKKTLTGTWADLVKSFNEKLDRLAKHQYTWIHQVEKCREVKNSLKHHEAVVHMDFSENYACKLNVEVQHFHWGGSRKQATVHTCMAYTEEGSQAYATISDSLRHDERAVWAHLKPVLDDIQRNPRITTVHFMSDGPLTQYRNRKNFYLMCTLPFIRGIKEMTWNFSEKAHGKGAPDGVGGSIKRIADAFVLQGGDIQHPEELFSFLEKSNSSVKFHWVSEADIARVDEAVPDVLPVVRGTLGIHQVTTNTPGKISCRELSCFCHRMGLSCECESPSVLNYNTEKAAPSATIPTQDDVVGKMVIVSYDKKPFVGQVLKVVGEEVEVSCMQQSGTKNCFVWPQIRDVVFYFQTDVIAVISEPEPSTSRSSRLSLEDWERFILV
ncbi:uncharacterized protein LOC134863258 isoform X1 [Eleginops maclovinus]|uniref:uncharacterized protein LOC134863258 isoform X1 n=2 Tax=Eleginops maclovinus TaxID=56733 RepID=UPI0030805010